MTMRVRVSVWKFIFFLLIVVTLLYFLGISEEIDSRENKVLKTIQGLRIKGNNFTMEGKPFRILGGALHYFRVPRRHWEDRIVKMQAMGLNTLETYIPWNIHELEPGVYDFTDNKDISDFIHLAQVFGLYVIIRPGPYICSEWDLGGLPSWLLRDPHMKLRSSYKPFLKAVDRYFDKLMPILRSYQFSNGGPIIAFQIENEYGVYGEDMKYMQHLKEGFIKRGISELLFICDNIGGLGKAPLDGVLQTVNFQSDANKMFGKLKKIQPNKPLFVTEFWIGWFDHWGERHHVVDDKHIASTLAEILDQGGSFIFYMWHGGTNFGFMNGANTQSKGIGYTSDTTSYDYDAPVSEVGDLTKKFFTLKEVMKEHAPPGMIPESLPWVPTSRGLSAYGDITVSAYLTLHKMLEYIKPVESKDVMPMEMLPINNDAGQSYGFILYTTTMPLNAKTLLISNANDYVTVLVNKEPVKTTMSGQKVTADLPFLENKQNTLDILVENCGRINYDVLDNQRKGILGHVKINGKKHQDWMIYPLEFKQPFLTNILASKSWETNLSSRMNKPAVYKGNLYVHSMPRDTYLHVKGWSKGVVFINDINIGRYFSDGPQETLYVPGSWLFKGDNTVLIFEQHEVREPMKMKSIHEPIFSGTVTFKVQL